MISFKYDENGKLIAYKDGKLEGNIITNVDLHDTRDSGVVKYGRRKQKNSNHKR